jgi:signal transduction histidine kinase
MKEAINHNGRHLMFPFIFVVLFVFFSSFLLWSETTARNSYLDQTAAMLGEALRRDPQLEAPMVLALKEPDPENIRIGKSLMARYGYQEYAEGGAKLPSAGLWMAALCALSLVLFGYGLRRSYKRQERLRIKELTEYLRELNSGNYCLRPDHQEDRFSGLEDEVYKTVVLLREGREQMAKQKQSLADNLADIAHQLKTPLSSITLLSDLLIDQFQVQDKPPNMNHNISDPKDNNHSLHQDSTNQNISTLKDTDRSLYQTTRNQNISASTDINLSLKHGTAYQNISTSIDDNHYVQQNTTVSTGEGIQYAQTIADQAQRMTTLLSGLLTLSRMDAGSLELEHKPVDVEELLWSAGETVHPLISQKHQTLTYHITPCHITGDFHWLVEAIINLLKNCTEHTQPGGEISITCESNPIYTKIIIEDNGSGAAKEDLPHLFQRFYRGKNAAKDSIGIGLALTKSIIERSRGEIKAQNRPEGGMRFSIKLMRSV